MHSNYGEEKFTFHTTKATFPEKDHNTLIVSQSGLHTLFTIKYPNPPHIKRVSHYTTS